MKNHIIEGSIRIKKIYANLPWRSAIIGITDHGLLVNLDLKPAQSWINYSYKFTYINENVEYIEKEDEFDQNLEDSKSNLDIKAKDILDIPEDSFIREIRIKKKPFPQINFKEEDQIEEKKEDEIKHEELEVAIDHQTSKDNKIDIEGKQEEVDEKIEEKDDLKNADNFNNNNDNNKGIDEE